MFEDAIFVFIGLYLCCCVLNWYEESQSEEHYLNESYKCFFNPFLDLTEAKVFKFTNLTNRKHGST